MTIDMHAHLLPVPLVEALRARKLAPTVTGDELVMPVARIAFHAGFTDVSARIALMDRHGIDLQLLSLPCLFGIDSLPATEAAPLVAAFNAGAAEAATAYPDRFRWLAALPLADGEGALAELDAALGDPHCLGVILPGDAFASVAAAQAMECYLERLQGRGGGLAFIHPGRMPGTVPDPAPYPDLGFARRQLDIQTAIAQTAITCLYSELLAPFPDVTVQIANLGGTLPMVMERIDQVIDTRNLPEGRRARPGQILVDIASLGPHAIDLAAAVLGRDALVFGTDCPIFDTAASTAAVVASGLDRDGRSLLLHGTATRLIERLENRA